MIYACTVMKWSLWTIGGDKIPRKGGPGVTQSDLLVVNKTDLAEAVGASLEVDNSFYYFEIDEKEEEGWRNVYFYACTTSDCQSHCLLSGLRESRTVRINHDRKIWRERPWVDNSKVLFLKSSEAVVPNWWFMEQQGSMETAMGVCDTNRRSLFNKQFSLWCVGPVLGESFFLVKRRLVRMRSSTLLPFVNKHFWHIVIWRTSTGMELMLFQIWDFKKMENIEPNVEAIVWNKSRHDFFYHYLLWLAVTIHILFICQNKKEYYLLFIFFLPKYLSYLNI